MWSEQSAKDKQPYEQKAAKLKEKYKKDITAYRATGRLKRGQKGPWQADRLQEEGARR